MNTRTHFALEYGPLFDKAPMPVQARMVATALRNGAKPELRLAALLDELAGEVELGQRSRLTFRGDALEPTSAS